MAGEAFHRRFRRMLEAILTLVDRTSTPYYIGGGVAASALGRPRATEDVDVTILPSPVELGPFLDAARADGFEFDPDDVRMQVEVNGFFRIYFPAGEEKQLWTDFLIGETDFEKRVWERRWRGRTGGREISVASPEDLLLLKILAWRPKDQEDVRNLILRRGDRMDRAYLRVAVQELARLARRPDLPVRLAEVLSDPTDPGES